MCLSVDVIVAYFGCSRKRFSEKEAQRWWEEKQVLVCNKYDAEA